MTAMMKTLVDTKTIQEPTGKSRNKETRRPDTFVVVPIMGEAITIFLMSSKNWRAEEAGLKSRA